MTAKIGKAAAKPNQQRGGICWRGENERATTGGDKGDGGDDIRRNCSVGNSGSGHPFLAACEKHLRKTSNEKRRKALLPRRRGGRNQGVVNGCWLGWALDGGGEQAAQHQALARVATARRRRQRRVK